MALKNGMDIKTLSAALGHTSSENTIDIYSHITDVMRQQAAVKIDRQISGTEAEISQVKERERVVDANQPDFEPYKPKICKSGAGCVTMINDHLFEGRTPMASEKAITSMPKPKRNVRKNSGNDNAGQG